MKKIFIISICLLLFLFPLSAAADTVDQGTISSAAVNYFEGVVNKLPAGYDYFIYKSGDYTATMIYSSDLTLTDSVVSGTDVTQLIYNSRSQSDNYNYIPSFTESHLESIAIVTDYYSIAYSSLGSWSALGQTSNNTLTYILYSVILILLIFVVFKLIRNRRHYINL